MPTLRQGYERHEIQVRPETWADLMAFIAQNGFRSVDEALCAFLSSWQQLKMRVAEAEQDRRAAAAAREEAERLRAEAEQQLAQVRAEVAQQEAQLQAREQQLRAAELAFLQGCGLSHRAVRFYQQVEEAGLGPLDVAQVVRLIRAAGCNFDRLEQALLQLGGARGLLAALAQLEQERNRLGEEVDQLRQQAEEARAELERLLQDKEALERELDQARGELWRAKEEFRLFTLSSKEFLWISHYFVPIMLEQLGRPGDTVLALPGGVTRAMAGVFVLMAAVLQGEDYPLELPRNVALGRYFPAKVSMEELATLLSGEEFVREFKKHLLRMKLDMESSLAYDNQGKA